MKFQNYLLVEGRSKPIKEKDLKKHITKHHTWLKDGLDNGFKILRGLSASGANHEYSDTMDIRASADFMYVQPSRYNRKPNNAGTNLYFLIMDNHSSWRAYPNRSQSLIGSAAGGKASGYDSAGLFYLVPSNGAAVALASDRDIWNSFGDIGHSLGWQMEALSDWMDEMLQRHMNINPVMYGVSTTWSDFINAADDIDNYMFQDLDHWGRRDAIEGHKLQWFYNEYKHTEDLVEALAKLMNPKKNKIKLIHDPKQLSVHDQMEIWTDSDCLMINQKYLEHTENVDKLRELVGLK